MKFFSAIFKTKASAPLKLKALKYSNEDEYEGEIVNEKREGFGSYKFSNGNRYEGQWHNHMKHGQGKFYYQNGELYIGDWLYENKKHGQGQYFYTNGDRYDGEWCQNEKHGQGTIYFNDGQVFTGQFENNLKQGIGYLFVARHKKYFQNVYDGDEIIEESQKKDLPLELKRVLQGDITKKPSSGSKDPKITKDLKLEKLSSYADGEEQLPRLSQSNERRKSLMPHNIEQVEDLKIPMEEKSNHLQDLKSPGGSAAFVKHSFNSDSEEKSNSNACASMIDKLDKALHSFVSIDEPFYSNAQPHSQMGLDTLQVMENMDLIKENQKQLQFQEWTTVEVERWLNGEGLSQYTTAFKENEVDGKTLMSLTDKDLKEDLGVNVLGHRKHIIKQIEMYKHYYTRFLQNKHKQQSSSRYKKHDREYTVKTPDSAKNFNSYYSQDQQRFVHILNYMGKIEEDQQENNLASQHSNISSELQPPDSQQEQLNTKELSFDKKKKTKPKKKESDSQSSKSDTSVLSTDRRKKKLEDKRKKKQKKREKSSSSDSSDSQNSVSSKIKRTKKDNATKAGQKKKDEDDQKIIKKKTQKLKKKNRTLIIHPQSPEQVIPNGIRSPIVLDQEMDQQLFEFSRTQSIQIEKTDEQQQWQQDKIELEVKQHQLSPNLAISVSPKQSLNIDTLDPQEEKQSMVAIPATSPPMKTQMIDAPSQESDSQSCSMTGSSNSVSSESDDDQKKPQKSRQKSNQPALAKNSKIKRYNMSTFMNMLKEFGINEKVLINYKELDLLNKIGEGGYGEVYMGRWLGQEVAVKVYGRKKLRGSLKYKIQMADFLKEVEVISNLRHPNIVLYMGVCQKRLNYFLITEYLEQGSLFDHLHRKQTKFDDHRILQIVEDIALGMNYLNGRKVLHCDLKSSNVLIDQNWNVKLCDFGLSRMKNTSRSGRRIGTPHWMAPEIMRGEPYNEKADVYSFGMILWELATGRIPYEGLSITQILGSVGYGDDQVAIPQCRNQSLFTLMQMCLTKETTKRPSFNQIVHLIQKGKNRNDMLKSTIFTNSRLENAIRQLIDFFD